MARLASTLLVLALLGGTAAAFGVTEGLKLQKSPIARTRIEYKDFSPVCGCRKHATRIGFRLSSGDRLTVAMVDGGERVVRTLVAGRSYPRGEVSFPWDGRDDAGRVVPDGRYEPRVHLARQHRTILLPNPIRVDTKPPQIRLESVRPPTISPDGDRQADRAVVRYRLSEPAHAILYVDGVQRGFKRGQQLTGSIEWSGKRRGAGLPAGTYRLSLGAQDVAGNVAPAGGSVPLRIRYIELARRTIRLRARTRFGVRVATDARAFAWTLGTRSGQSRPGLLVLRAPRTRGRYVLTVREHGHAARATVIVERRR